MQQPDLELHAVPRGLGSTHDTVSRFSDPSLDAVDVGPIQPAQYEDIALVERPALDVLLIGRLQRNFTGADGAQIRRELRRARRLLLNWRLTESSELIDSIHRCLGDLPVDLAQRLRIETRVLRALGCALRDDALSALHIALELLRESQLPSQARTELTALCRFAYWRLRDFASLYALPRQEPTVIPARREVGSAILNLCVEASIELEQLRLPAARRLALHALAVAHRAGVSDGALAALPATIVAEVLYEQGYIAEAESCIRERLQVIKTSGVQECASRAYLILARIAMYRDQDELAMSLLQEAEDLGAQRGWTRLVAMSMSERVDWLLRADRVEDARLCAERLDRYIARQPARGYAMETDMHSYHRMTYARLALASASAAHAVAAMRELHHEAVVRCDLYCAMRLALQLAVSLEVAAEANEADRLVMRALRLGRIAGLSQIFIDAGRCANSLLLRAYDRAHRGHQFRDVLPYIGSLLILYSERGNSGRVSVPAARVADGLSPREREILALVARGLSNKRIAQTLTITPETVKSHVKRVFIKLEVKSRAQAVSRATAQGYLHVEESWSRTA